jgi:hypothetical protein
MNANPEEDVIMKRIVVASFAIGSIVIAACSESTVAPPSGFELMLASAYSSAPAGYSSLSSSFVGDAGDVFAPEFSRMSGGGRGPGGGGHHGPGPGFGLGFMGGGVFGGFLGDGFHRGSFATDTSCHYSTGTGIFTCGPTTRSGLTITRTIRLQNAAGANQSAYDTITTNTVTTTASVNGTVTRRDSSKSTISSSSNQVVTGLAATSAQRTVNSSSAGTENTTGKTRDGVAFTSKRTTGDTVKAVVIPRATTANPRPYPTAGTIIRAMAATMSVTGQTAINTSRREVITYDGSATAKVVITLNGVTQNCTLPLPHGRLACQ